jgi:hypothetical protein
VITFRLCDSTWEPGLIAAFRAHYTGSRGPNPGKKLAWEVLEGGAHRGWIALGEPPYKLAPRRRLGLADARPLPHTVLCTLYRLDAAGETVASSILRAWHPIAALDWQARYGWTPVHWETMAGQGEEVLGYCFRRAGYRSLGLTTGRTARRPAGHTHGPRVWSDAPPKLVLYRGPLARV